MTVLPIVIIPDPILRQTSAPVERVDDELRKFADNMLATMYDAPGVGLAAIQVAQPIRMLTVDVSEKDDEPEPQVFINPKIVQKSDTPNVYEEGCLSIPDVYADVERPAEVTVEYLDLSGKQKTILADGMLATVLQHEIDHLDGALFIDYLSKLKREMVIRKFKKLAKQRPL